MCIVGPLDVVMSTAGLAGQWATSASNAGSYIEARAVVYLIQIAIVLRAVCRFAPVATCLAGPAESENPSI